MLANKYTRVNVYMHILCILLIICSSCSCSVSQLGWMIWHAKLPVSPSIVRLNVLKWLQTEYCRQEPKPKERKGWRVQKFLAKMLKTKISNGNPLRKPHIAAAKEREKLRIGNICTDMCKAHIFEAFEIAGRH